MFRTTIIRRSAPLLVLLAVATACEPAEPPDEEGLPPPLATLDVVEEGDEPEPLAHVEADRTSDLREGREDPPPSPDASESDDDGAAPPGAEEVPPEEAGDDEVEGPPSSPAPEVLPAPEGCSRVRVVDTQGLPLNVRPDPDTLTDPIGQLEAGQRVDVIGVVEDGEAVVGTTRWYAIEDEPADLFGFVSAAFAACESAPEPEPEPAPDPPSDPDPEPDASGGLSFPRWKFLLPFNCGKTVRVSQGNNTSYSHQGSSRWAYDFAVPRGTKVRAMRKGRIKYLRRSTRPGDPCWSGGGASCITKANYVVIKHGDGTSTIYAHLNNVRGKVGDRVWRGQVIGRSGNTGYSSGPHLHVARQAPCGSSHCSSRKMKFADVGGDGRPNSGQWVTSQNRCGGN